LLSSIIAEASPESKRRALVHTAQANERAATGRSPPLSLAEVD